MDAEAVLQLSFQPDAGVLYILIISFYLEML